MILLVTQALAQSAPTPEAIDPEPRCTALRTFAQMAPVVFHGSVVSYEIFPDWTTRVELEVMETFQGETALNVVHLDQRYLNPKGDDRALGRRSQGIFFGSIDENGLLTPWEGTALSTRPKMDSGHPIPFDALYHSWHRMPISGVQEGLRPQLIHKPIPSSAPTSRRVTREDILAAAPESEISSVDLSSVVAVLNKKLQDDERWGMVPTSNFWRLPDALECLRQGSQ